MSTQNQVAQRPPAQLTARHLVMGLLRAVRAWLWRTVFAHLPMPAAVRAWITAGGTSVDAALWLVAVAVAAAGLQRSVVPWVAQRLVEATTLSVAALAMSHPKPTAVRSSITAVIRVPGPPLATRMVMRKPMRVEYKGKLVARARVVGRLNVPAGGGVVPMEAVMEMVDGSEDTRDAFSAFCRDLVLADADVPFTMTGDGIEVQLFDGRVAIPNLAMTKTVSLPGMGGLSNMSIESVLLVDTTVHSMTLQTVCIAVNPSPVTMASGTVRFAMTTPELWAESGATSGADDFPYLAEVTIPDMVLRPGANRLVATCTMRRPHPSTIGDARVVAAGLRILSRYLQGDASDVVVVGRAADAASYLTPAIQSVVVRTTLPPLAPRGTQPLLVQTTLALSQVNLLAQSVPANVTLANPFPLGMTVRRMRARATLPRASPTDAAHPMGGMDAAVMMYVPAHATVTPDESVPMQLQLGLPQLLAVAGSGGELRVDVACEIDCRVGLCALSGIEYVQENARVVLRL
ncbi:hypothetical protein H9P43_003738 [Blastocladiella emersonii ATCC 22665]|nr:hypothetical protein H9P43_003738 [Blastocladiella emersonii ATCC 22665]